jgi:hypothetical protein
LGESANGEETSDQGGENFVHLDILKNYVSWKLPS